MKYNIILFLFIVNLNVFGQQKSKLTLIYPEVFKYDTLLISNEKHIVLKETSKIMHEGKNISTYTIQDNPENKISLYSIYFGGKSVISRDTLYFNGRGNNMKIEIANSFELRKDYALKMDNCYNFEELWQRYTQGLDSAENNYDSNYINTSNGVYSVTNYKEEFTLNFLTENLENPNSTYLLGMFTMNQINYPNYDRIKLFYEQVLKETIKEQNLKNWIEERIEKINELKEGKLAPLFSFHTYDGLYIKGDSLRGKTILLTFWATWCPPCRAEFPSLRQINDKFKNEDFVFISVSMDADSLKALEMIKKENLSWLNVINDNRISKSFKINPIPAIFLINNEGVIEYNSIERRDKTDLKILKEILKEKYKL